MKSIAERFWEKVTVKGPDDCWNWTAHKDKDGYGDFWFEGKTVRAHRVSYQLNSGAMPKEMLVLHSCDNPSCVNPKHLRLGNDSDNMADMTLKGRNKSATLTLEQAIEVKKDNRTHSAIATEYGISRVTVCNIKAGRSWSRLMGQANVR